MEKLILIILLSLVLIWIVIVVFTVILEHENKKNQEILDEQFNNSMKSKCLRARKAKACTGCCENCTWALRQKNGVIEFRGKG